VILRADRWMSLLVHFQVRQDHHRLWQQQAVVRGKRDARMTDGGKTADGGPGADTFLVETPEQLKALAEPLRQSLLEQFCQPATIKAAAAKLGVPVTRL